MTVLLVILAVITFLFLLTLLPVQIKCTYGDKLEIQMKILFFTYRLMDTEAEEDTEAAVEKPEEAVEKETKTLMDKLKDVKRREGISGFLHFFQELVRLLLSTSYRVARHMKLKLFRLNITVGGDDAAAAALLYGETCAIVKPAYGMLFSRVNCKEKSARVDLDYQADVSKILFDCQLHIQVIFLLREGLRALKKGLPIIRRLK